MKSEVLPDFVTKQVFLSIVQLNSLFCCELDNNSTLLQMWGASSFYGFENWTVGKKLNSESFLFGMPDNESWVMRDVDISTNNHCDIYFSVSCDEKRYLSFVSTQDSISKRRELQQRGNDLVIESQKNNQIIKSLELTKTELNSENILKSRFIAGMSHEFRTPITSIIGYTRLIAEQTGLDQAAQMHLEAVDRASQHLLSLVENLLDQARFETNSFALNETDVNLEDLIAEVAAVTAPLAGSKSLGFTAEIAKTCPRFAILDVVRVRQILINLLANAVKFTDDGFVSLHVDISDNFLVFSVKDTGSGIIKEEQKNIFSAFNRLDEHSAKPGVGLGLNIVERLVECMHGKIELKSQHGEGSEFVVKIPYKKADDRYIHNNTQPIPVFRSEQQTKNILLVEDNPDISNLLKLLLTRESYYVKVAENGELALTYLENENFDLIVTDLQMPVLNGIDLVKRLRSRGYKKPIVALSASHKLGEREKMKQIGFSAFLTKPIEMTELVNTLNSLTN